MPRYILLFLLLYLNMPSLIAVEKPDTAQVSLKIIETTDVHGNFFPYDFINRRPWDSSLAQVAAYVGAQREAMGDDNLILVDNGDILQGQPTVYFYNFIDTASTHIAAKMMNYMKYDAAAIGNHDIETGHAVYDRWIAQCGFPVLGANVIDTATGEPYLTPYNVVSRNGVKIAILGMITPAVPSWLPETLWSGLRFDDMEETARRWIPIIKEREDPDFIIGVFHSGSESRVSASGVEEDASLRIAQEVPGFDIVFMGHDHRRYCQAVKNVEGKEVHVINAASNAGAVGEVEINLQLVDGKIVSSKLTSRLVDMKGYEPTADFNEYFAADREKVTDIVSKKIGYCDRTITTADAYFGSSAFMDFIHQLQLKLSGADLSFAAPLSFNAKIKEGNIYMSDMFNLYKYENMLYVMELSGREIKDYLEMSYDLWINTISSADEQLMKLETTNRGRLRFENPTYNFDSAAGIIYTVDVTKVKGSRITIVSMAGGAPFDQEKMYRVAINSYRGNGGGGLLTDGAGIPAEQLSNRIKWSTDIDLRYYLMKEIELAGTISPRPLNQWRFVPEEIAAPAVARSRALLFR